MSILDTFNESDEAIKAYRKLHKSEPSRELYVAHTAKENLEIQERNGKSYSKAFLLNQRKTKTGFLACFL